MIVPARSLVVPVAYHGWLRPPTYYIPLNFRLPNGIGGLVNGIVEEVPAGTDIKPESNPATDYLQLNCQTVGRYRPPSYLKFERPIYDGSGSLFTSDMELKDVAGNNIQLLAAAGAMQGIFGTFFSISAARTTAAGWVRDVFTVRSVRSAVFEITDYEEGTDGIVTPVIQTGNPFAVKAFRLSDQTYQVLANCGIEIPAGVSQFTLYTTWASGTISPLATLGNFRISIEVPYGL